MFTLNNSSMNYSNILTKYLIKSVFDEFLGDLYESNRCLRTYQIDWYKN